MDLATRKQTEVGHDSVAGLKSQSWLTWSKEAKEKLLPDEAPYEKALAPLQESTEQWLSSEAYGAIQNTLMNDESSC